MHSTSQAPSLHSMSRAAPGSAGGAGGSFRLSSNQTPSVVPAPGAVEAGIVFLHPLIEMPAFRRLRGPARR